MYPPPITADEETAVLALTKLVKGHQPRSSGGFDPDDVSMHCRLSSAAIKQHLDQLVTLGAVTDLESPMSDDAWPTHYTLKPL